jgi:hypothetical protein
MERAFSWFAGRPPQISREQDPDKQRKTVRIDRIIHGARMDETRRGVLGNACSFVLISAISDLEFQGICQIREFDRFQAGIDARPWLAI